MIQTRIRAALKQAMIDRDRSAVDLLRTVLGAIDNATAVASAGSGLAIEASPIGVGASDVPGRSLSDDEIVKILEAEATERDEAAVVYRTNRQDERARRMEEEATLIRSFLPGT